MARTDKRMAHVAYDPESDVVVLGLDGEPAPGGRARELSAGNHLAALLRIAPDGPFDHLEVLGASRAVPHVLAQLEAPADGARGYRRGTVVLPMTVADDRDSVRVDLSPTPDVAEGPTFEVRAETSGALVATLTTGADGVLRALTLHDVDRLLDRILEPVTGAG